MAQSHQQQSWNCLEIWNNFISHSKQMNPVELEIDFYIYMVDFLSKTLHKLWQEKCEKLEEANRDIGEFVICSSCNDLLVDGVTLLCGHTYCRKCLKKRESESFIELCHRCDKNSEKHSKWFFKQRTVVDGHQKNVMLNAIIYENYTNELQAINIRLEGNKFLEQKDYIKATEKYQEAVEICPTSFMSWSNLAQVKSSQNYFEEALYAAQMSIKISPSWPKGYYREGIAYKGLSTLLLSALSFFKYLILEPSSVSVKKLLAECLLELVDSQCLLTQESETNDEHSSSREEFKKQCVEDLMKDVLQKGIEFCLLQNPSSRRFPAQLTSQNSMESLKNFLTCPLCCRVFYEPTTTPCGHTFCIRCLERSLDFRNCCSICRNPLNELITLKPKPIDEIIDTLVQKYFEKDHEENRCLILRDAEVLQYDYDVKEVARIPIFVCTPVFPTTECPLHVFEPRYKLMMRKCLAASSKVFGMCMYNELNGFSDYGTLLEIRSNRYLDDGRLLVDTIGGKRFKVLERDSRDGYATAKVQFISDAPSCTPEELNRLVGEVYNESKAFLSSLPNVIYNTVNLKYGDLPAMNDSEGEHGPKWAWYMLRLLVQNESEDIVKALKCDDLQERCVIIKENIRRMKRDIFQAT